MGIEALNAAVKLHADAIFIFGSLDQPIEQSL
jgi:hypothetical protein